MDLHAQLAVAKQSFDELIALCEPRNIGQWRPTGEQRVRYIDLATRTLDGIDRLSSEEQRALFVGARVHSFVPDTLLAAVRERIEPAADALRTALDSLDPEGREARDALAEFLKARETDGSVKLTLAVGLDQIEELIDRNPDWGNDHPFSPGLAREVLDSKLIQFDPDAWSVRANSLTPVRTNRSNFDFPSHVRLRLEELYRVYIFGCWLSVFGLSRAILEYAILDNLTKFGIEATWPADKDGVRRPRKLSHLIDDVAMHLPGHADAMAQLREWGNEYLHPKKSRVGALFERQRAAQSAVETLVEVVEAIYLAPRKT